MEKKTLKQGADTASGGERSTFSGRLGYVLAVAGSAVGLGNIWRFPYLAAKYGGGIFVLVYLLLVVTFGYTLIVSETALGRMTKKSPIGAYNAFGHKPWIKVGGWINAIVPMLIVPYYCVIGGWVIKYLVEYLGGGEAELAENGYFDSFITDSATAELWFVVFALLVFLVVIIGVEKGVEAVSKFMMPLLVIMAMIVAIYSVTRPGALAGVRYLFVPDFSGFSMMTIVAAMGQMFYSLSIAMGILYTYGSYLKKDVDIEKSTWQLAAFDTGIAILAGLMIIPSVFAFSGGSVETLKAGPSLMFITIPKVFDSMGMGNVVGSVFFLMVLFAALTSAISLMETCVSTVQDEMGFGRKKSCLFVLGIMLLLGSASALGFGVWDFVTLFGMSVLDFFDFITNSLLMPIGALLTCLLVVRVVGREKIAQEVRISSAFRLEKLYNFFIKYLAPICLLIILASAIAGVLGWIQM